jgi:hypothetical protein
VSILLRGDLLWAAVGSGIEKIGAAGMAKVSGLGGIRRRVGRCSYALFALATASLRVGQSLDQAVCLSLGLVHRVHRCFSRSSRTGHRFVTCPNPAQKPHLWACRHVRTTCP